MPINSLDHLMRKTTDGSVTSVDWQYTTNRQCIASTWNDLSAINSGIANLFPGTSLQWVNCNSSTPFALFPGQPVDEASGFTKHVIYASVLSASSTAVPGVLLLVDMQGYWPGIPLTTGAQTLLGTPTLRYINGEGLKLYPVITTATGSATPTLSLSYTNQAGAPNRNLSHTITMISSAQIGRLWHSSVTVTATPSPFLPLAGGDTGVQNVNSITMSSATTGAIALCLVKPLLTVPIVSISSIVERDFVTQLTTLPEVKNDACLTWLYFSGASAAINSNIYGSLEMVWG